MDKKENKIDFYNYNLVIPIIFIIGLLLFNWNIKIFEFYSFTTIIVIIYFIYTKLEDIAKFRRISELEDLIRWRVIAKKLKLTGKDWSDVALEVDKELGKETRISIAQDIWNLTGVDWVSWVFGKR